MKKISMKSKNFIGAQGFSLAVSSSADILGCNEAEVRYRVF